MITESATDVRAPRAMSAAAYDEQWRELDDFIRYNPGARHRRRQVLRMIASLPFRSYVEIGCGPAEFLMLLSEQRRDCELWGADLSGEVVERNREKLPTITFEQLDIQEDRLDRTFDLVACQEVVEHLNDRTKAFENLAAMVAPGGHLLVTCPTGTLFETERHFGHTTHPDVREIERHARAQGLEVVHMYNWGFPLYRLMKVATNVNAAWALKNFAEGEYSWAKKRLNDALYLANFANVRSPWGCQLFALLRKPEG